MKIARAGPPVARVEKDGIPGWEPETVYVAFRTADVVHFSLTVRKLASQ